LIAQRHGFLNKLRHQQVMASETRIELPSNAQAG